MYVYIYICIYIYIYVHIIAYHMISYDSILYYRIFTHISNKRVLFPTQAHSLFGHVPASHLMLA